MASLSALRRVAPLLLLTACHGALPDGPLEATCEGAAAIVDGAVAVDATLDAIGALGVPDGSGGTRFFCTATLIAPTVVLTAKHCTMTSNGEPLLSRGPVVFAVGSDAEHPRAIIAAVSAETATPELGGVAELGSDLAVFHLETAVTGIAPMALSTAPLADEDLGAALFVYGYGADAPDGSVSKPMRRAGVEALSALRGNVFDAIYGDHAAYLAKAPADGAPADLAERYKHGVLLPGYEVWATRDPAQTCHGDSGGPVVRCGSTPEILGVISWSWQSAARRCDDGTVIAVPGPEAAKFLRRVLADAESGSVYARSGPS